MKDKVKPNLKFLHYGISHQGKVRKENQDAYGVFIKNNWGIYAVCDGMGGAKGGRVASSLCLELLSFQLEKCATITIDTLLENINLCNKIIYKLSQEDSNLQGMGTTLVLFADLPEGFYGVHVGDSRLYRLRKNNLDILTRDHTYAQDLIDSGTLSESSAKRSPISHLLTKAVGTEPNIFPEVRQLTDVLRDDIYILTSDGIYAHLNRPKMEEIISRSSKSKGELKELVSSISHGLIDETLSAGATDNTTVLVLGTNREKDIEPEPFSSSISSLSGYDLDQLLIRFNNDSGPISSVIIKAGDEARAASSSFNSSRSLGNFLVLLALVIGAILWFVISNNESTNELENINSSKLTSLINQIIEQNKLVKTDSKRISSESELLLPFKAYTLGQNKYIEIASTPEESPPITINAETLKEEQALSPIEWDKEKEIIEKIKVTAKLNKKTDSPTIKKGTLGPGEKIEIISRKEILRETLWDIDYRIQSLAINQIDEESLRSVNIADKEAIEKDIEIVSLAIKEITLREKKLKSINNIQDIDQQLEILRSIYSTDPELESLRVNYSSLKQNTEFYANLLKQSASNLEIANKLAAAKKKEENALALLKDKVIARSKNMEFTIKEHVSVLELLKASLRIEGNRTSRSLGFIGAYSKLDEKSKISIWKNLIQRRNELYSEYNLLENSLPLGEEFKEQLRITEDGLQL